MKEMHPQAFVVSVSGPKAGKPHPKMILPQARGRHIGVCKNENPRIRDVSHSLAGK
jgi:hypothetical protein